MAKVNAPLLSGAAYGSIGKTLTFSTHHGVNVVGEHNTPTQPETPPQIDERDAIRAAAAEWNRLNLAEYDLQAWNTLAKLRKKTYSGYALFVKLFIPKYNEGLSWTGFRNMRITALGTTSLTFLVDAHNWAEPLMATRTGTHLHGDVYIDLVGVGGVTWEGTFKSMQRGDSFHFWTYTKWGPAHYGQSGAYYAKLKWAW